MYKTYTFPLQATLHFSPPLMRQPHLLHFLHSEYPFPLLLGQTLTYELIMSNPLTKFRKPSIFYWSILRIVTPPNSNQIVYCCEVKILKLECVLVKRQNRWCRGFINVFLKMDLEKSI